MSTKFHKFGYKKCWQVFAGRLTHFLNSESLYIYDNKVEHCTMYILAPELRPDQNAAQPTTIVLGDKSRSCLCEIQVQLSPSIKG